MNLNKDSRQALLNDSKAILNTKEQPTQSLSDQITKPKQASSLTSKQLNQSSKVTKKKDKKSKLQKNFTFVLKIFNILVGLLVISFGIYCYYGNNDKSIKNLQLIGYIMPGYIAFSGLIIIAVQMHINFICRNMKFLYNYFGRGFFNIYVGIMPLTLLDETEGNTQPEMQKVAIYILVSLMLFIGVLYIISKVCCCAKEGDKRKHNKNKAEGLSDSSSSSD